MEICEPRQVWKEATVSKYFHVPGERLSGVNCLCNAYGNMTESGVRPFYFIVFLLKNFNTYIKNVSSKKYSDI